MLRNTASNIVIDLIVEQQEMAIVPLPYLLPWVLPRFLQENHRALGLGGAVAMGSSGGKSVLRRRASSTAGK